jgi:hypothetical protein
MPGHGPGTTRRKARARAHETSGHHTGTNPQLAGAVAHPVALASLATVHSTWQEAMTRGGDYRPIW